MFVSIDDHTSEFANANEAWNVFENASKDKSKYVAIFNSRKQFIRDNQGESGISEDSSFSQPKIAGEAMMFNSLSFRTESIGYAGYFSFSKIGLQIAIR